MLGRRYVSGLVVGLVGLLAALSGLAAPEAAGQESWTRLGPPGPGSIIELAVSPRWPAEPLLLGVRLIADVGGPGQLDLVRSGNGGASWERLAAPASRAYGLVLAPGQGDERPAFLVEGSPGYGGPKQLHRSPDAGASWTSVLAVEASYLDPQWSPDFAADGLVLAVGGGQLHRSTDGGRSFQVVSLPDGQLAMDARFSPDFAHDRTVFLALSSAPIADKPTGQADHELSAGLAVSTDGGASFAVLGGPSLDGVAYRQLSRLVVSPTFGRDGNLFAVGYGPFHPRPVMGGSIERQDLALFRSRDRGQSWQLALKASESVYNYGLALSPRFADDGVALVTIATRVLSPASHSCSWRRTADDGASWTTVRPGGSYEGCGQVRLVAQAERLIGIGAENRGWKLSQDGGVSWTALTVPESSVRSLTLSPAFATDGLIFAGAEFGGVWALGGGLSSTDGRLACPAGLQGGFARIFEAEQWARSRLGCPLEAEREVRIRERQFDDREFKVRAYWTEDHLPRWYRLSRTERYQGWYAETKAEHPWPAAPDRVFDGVVQQFEGGLMLWLNPPDGQPSILVLSRPGGLWQEWPD